MEVENGLVVGSLKDGKGPRLEVFKWGLPTCVACGVCGHVASVMPCLYKQL